MRILDRLFGKPSVAIFAEPMIQAFREAGDKTDLRFDASENRIVRNDPDSPWVAHLDTVRPIRQAGHHGLARTVIQGEGHRRAFSFRT